MSFTPYIPLLGFVCNLVLALFILKSNPREPVNRVYFALGTAISGWNLAQFFGFTVSDPETGLFWIRALWMCVISGAFVLVHLSLLIAEISPTRYTPWLYSVCSVFLLLNLTPIFIKGVRWLEIAGWYAIPGPALYAYIPVFTSFLITSIYLLIQRRRKLPRLHKSRLNAMIAATALLLASGCNDVLPILTGIEYYPLTNVRVFPYGSVLAVFYGLIVGYSVLQYQLLDIHITLSRIAAQMVRFTFVLFIGLVLLLLATLIGPGQFTIFSFSASLIVMILSGLIASLFFPRMFGSGLENLERRIRGDRFEYHDRIRSFIDSLQYYFEIDPLLSDLGALLSKTLGAQNYYIILRDETNRSFSLVRSHPPRAPEEIKNIESGSAIFRYFEESRSEYLTLYQGAAVARHAALGKRARADLSQFDSDFCFPFFFNEEPFGLLLLGPKANNALYTANDMSLLTLLVQRLSLIINQLRLQAQVFQQQELELLGRMSRGIAHDLNNLLTPISTFFQLSSEGVPTEILNEDLLPVANRNLATMRAYIRESLFFSDNLRPDFQLGRLDIVLASATELARNSRANREVTVLCESAGETLVEMDEVLIQRMLSNIIANAIDASEQGSTVRAELLRLARSKSSRDWLRVRIVDAGEGIAEKDIERVFTPYYTTKNRGDRSRGFGLGLAICRKIVNLHSGTLTVASQPGRGTTVQIDLPSRQLPNPTPSVQNVE